MGNLVAMPGGKQNGGVLLELREHVVTVKKSGYSALGCNVATGNLSLGGCGGITGKEFKGINRQKQRNERRLI